MLIKNFMTSPFAITLLILSQGLISTRQAAAEARRVEFHTFSSASPEVGVQANITVKYPDNTNQDFDTDAFGRAVAMLKSCDASVRIEARSLWGDHTKKSKSCDPVPVELPMTPTIQMTVIQNVLYRVLNTEGEPFSGNERHLFQELKKAVESGDVAAAAETANELQWSLYTSGESRTAYEFGLFAQSAGFEAMTAADIIDLDLPDTGNVDLLTIDPARDIIVMSDEGRLLLTAAQRELGATESGDWDYQTFQALRSTEGRM